MPMAAASRRASSNNRRRTSSNTNLTCPICRSSRTVRNLSLEITSRSCPRQCLSRTAPGGRTTLHPADHRGNNRDADEHLRARPDPAILPSWPGRNAQPEHLHGADYRRTGGGSARKREALGDNNVYEPGDRSNFDSSFPACVRGGSAECSQPADFCSLHHRESANRRLRVVPAILAVDDSGRHHSAVFLGVAERVRYFV